MRIGIQIRLLRVSREHSQTVMAESIGISQKVISAFECGYRQPQLPCLERISAVYGVDIVISAGVTSFIETLKGE